MGRFGHLGEVNLRAIATGGASALVVLSLVGALFLARPNVGFLVVFGVMFLGLAGLFLTVQHRTVTEHRGVTRPSGGEGRHLRGERGGVFGAWILGGSGDQVEAQLHRATAVVTFLACLTVGCFLLIFLAHPVADRLATMTG